MPETAAGEEKPGRFPGTAPRKEGRAGIVLTALICGAVLWWWFGSRQEDPLALRNPRAWLQEALKQPPSSPAADYDLLLVARLALHRGDRALAEEAAAAQRHPAFRQVALATAPAAAPAGGRLPHSPVAPSLRQALSAVDLLDFERAREHLRQAGQTAASLPEAERPTAWACLAAVHLILGDPAAAGDALQALEGPGAGAALPADAALLLAGTDAVAPVLSWVEAQPASSTSVPEVVRTLVGTIDERLQHGEASDLVVLGSAARPGRTRSARQQSLVNLWSALEEGDPEKAAAYVKARPPAARGDAALAMTRALLWIGRPRAGAVPAGS